MRLNKENLLLYAVTDRSWTGDISLFEQIRAALEGGVTLVQLREKDMPLRELLNEAIMIRELCHSYGVPLIVNDDPEVAVRSGADGVHVGAEDMTVAEVRRRYGNDLIIGATVKSTDQAKIAESQGADYLGAGAMFPSSTKKNAIPMTRDLLREITSSVSIPTVAIGGISTENAGFLAGCGVSGIAVVSAIFGAYDIKKECDDLKNIAAQITVENGGTP